jgi:3-oxoacyl-[acyl-carrier-protein] synthase III/NAD(P)-dependent dehydrogenase (short-subunit alcohol dehydrogenase family)
MHKKFENYIFSGFGLALGAHKITNQQIEQAINNGYLSGFNASRVEVSEPYQKAIIENPKLTPFEFMAKHMMGFEFRYHVVPFPPVKKNYLSSETSLDLCVKAVQKALENANVHPETIGAWIVGTATPHEQAPGMAATLKSYFTEYENQTQTMTLTSACVGFNINLERGMLFLQNHPEYQHVVIAHTEVMSELLLNEDDFVPSTTFGDAAAAVVLSKINSDKPEGLIKIVNYEDLRMIDFLGANKNGDLYMEPRMVKRRAVPNMTSVAQELMKHTGWNVPTTDLFIPHQTGHAIVKNVADNLGFSNDKLYQDVQMQCGNLSGASVPAALSLLQDEEKLKPGMRILTSVAGLGGEYGGFAYVVPEFKNKQINHRDMEGSIVLLTGATGGLGTAITYKLAERGAELILQYNRSDKKVQEITNELKKHQVKFSWIQIDFADPEAVTHAANSILKNYPHIDYLVHTVASTGPVKRATEIHTKELESIHNINFLSAKALTEVLFTLVEKAILFTGSVAEDAQFSGSSAYVSSKKALHSYAFEVANRAYEAGIRCLYYMPGIVDGGMAETLDNAQKAAGMMEIGQKNRVLPSEIADRMVRSLYLPKVMYTRNIYEGNLQVRKDSYMKY